MSSPQILYCHCAYARVVPEDVKQDVLAKLCASGQSFDGVADLCEMSAKKDPSLLPLAQQPGLKIAACYPRAVKWLFAAAGAPLQNDVQVLNMRTQSAEEIADELLNEGVSSSDHHYEENGQS
ncbi:MAG: hypothetical protein KDA86_21960 [Planctomycetaceae bacterium]|nr:hypothetical protein [Planctomycetaceae bacterium]